MNGLIKQLFTQNCPVAQLTEYRTERHAGLGSNTKGFSKTLS